MYTTLTRLVHRLEHVDSLNANIIPWACPTPVFGDLARSVLATVGLNPSSREFLDNTGKELKGKYRRLHTLNSLNLDSWSQAEVQHLQMIVDSCRSYFRRNPYNSWFGRLNDMISAANVSYYDSGRSACHLDLIPYATQHKWMDLNQSQRLLLLSIADNALTRILCESPVQIIILNGSSVVSHFQKICGTILDEYEMRSWSLPRKSKNHVVGFAYKGIIDTIAGVSLGREVLVLGFNHNIQSSFGVTRDVTKQVRNWISNSVTKFMS